MAKFILGKKLHMTQKFLADGTWVPVTVVEAGPCTVTQVKGEKDGYKAVQLGFGFQKKLNKPLAGHFKGLENFRYVREFRVEDNAAFERGKVIDVTSFQTGDKLDVTAVSKGKGFQGVVKRHGFHGSPATHGHKDQLRMPGSIGSGGVQHVFKGTRMAGRMGGDQVTLHNLEVIEVDAEKNWLYVKGAVPGARNVLVMIKAAGDPILKDKVAVKESVAEEKAEPVTPELNEEKVATPTEEIVIEEASEVKTEATPETKAEEKVEEAKKE